MDRPPLLDTEALQRQPPSVRDAALWAHLGPQAAAVQAAARTAEGLGLQLHLVGGCVRDWLLHTAARDVDLVVTGPAAPLAQALAAAHGGKVRVAQAFGTAAWKPADWHGGRLDFATARAEHYPTPAALPVVRQGSFTEDLQRRDFTCNAMAVALTGAQRGQLQDPFGGRADLQQGLLRVLHAQSFVDDPTRLLRAARFAARLQARLEPQTAAWMRDAQQSLQLRLLSPERLGAELDSLFAEDQAVAALRLVQSWSLLAGLQPPLDFAAPRLRQMRATLKVRALLQAAPSGSAATPSFAASAPCPSGDQPTQRELLWLEVACAAAPEDRAAVSRLAGCGGSERLRLLQGPSRLQKAETALHAPDLGGWNAALSDLDSVELLCLAARRLPPKARRHLAWWAAQGRFVVTCVSGDALRQAGFTPGPRFKPALQAALAAARAGAGEAAQWAAARAALAADA
jgi:tRNA nucleotidyltransferase/poly(A) polymerase